MYLQDGVEIDNPMTHVSWMDEFNSLTDKNCASLKGTGHNAFKDEGGMSSMGGAF